MTHTVPPFAQTPPGASSPELYTGVFGSGLSGAGRPSVSIRSNLPASDAASDGSPAAPVATSSAFLPSVASAPPLSREPRGMPVSTGFGSSPGASRTTRLSVGVVA